MGGSGNWLKSLVSHKKSKPHDQEKVADGKKINKWKIWKSSCSIDSGLSVKKGQVAASQPPDLTTSVANDVYTAAMATLIRAPPKNFLIVRKEWAAIRIQTAFRALLARRALRALRALVRLQALVRGRLVRKQAAMTLKCMQALVRAQAQIKAHRVRISMEGKSRPNKLDNQPHSLKQPEHLRESSDLNPRKKDSFSGPIESRRFDKSNFGWVASEPCEEIRSMEEADLDFSPDSATSSPLPSKHKKGKPISKAKSRATSSNSGSWGYESIRVTRNNTTKRVTARSKTHNDERSSSSSVSSSTTVEGADESRGGFGCSKPRFMNLTVSKVAKQSPKGGIGKVYQREALHSPRKLNGFDWNKF